MPLTGKVYANDLQKPAKNPIKIIKNVQKLKKTLDKSAYIA